MNAILQILSFDSVDYLMQLEEKLLNRDQNCFNSKNTDEKGDTNC